MTSRPSTASFSWAESGFDYRNPEAYDLSILLRPDGYFYVITGLEKGKAMAMGRVEGDGASSARKKSPSGIPGGPYRKVFLYRYSDEFSLIPVQLQEVYAAEEDLDAGPATFAISKEMLCQFQVLNGSATRFSSFGKAFSHRHFAASAIALALRQARDMSSDLLLAVAGHGLLTTIFAGRDGLEFADAYPVRTEEDMIYYLLNVYRHFSPQHPDIITVLSGDLDLDQPSGILISPYLGRKESLIQVCPHAQHETLAGEEHLFLSSLCVL